jgi:hypothetical protein
MKNYILYALVILFSVSVFASAQTPVSKLHGDERYSYKGLHSGNMIRTTFHNDGQVGAGRNDPEAIGGEWPINSGRDYLAKMSMFVGAEVKDINAELKHIVSEANGTATGDPTSATSGDCGPNGEWWSFCPLPGFANDDSQRIAMSHWKWSWPGAWPDKFDDTVDPGWPGSWNGYFGKNILNADQESYYVMDDYNNREFAFYPDSTDSLRRGLGIRVTVRGFQWSNVLVEDVLFLLYDVKNIGTFFHDKMNFGEVVGPNIGSMMGVGSDSEDDGGAYNLQEELGYQYDADDIGAGGWTPVGYLGITFFESPGNPFDGIDNDGDASAGSGGTITENTFAPVVYNTGDPVVVIDYTSFKRTVVQMQAQGVSIQYQKKNYTFLPGQELVEIANNHIDDNLNGIIDENNGSVFGEGVDAINRYLYLGLKYVDYITGSGTDNILIDEKRDDGIDNDGDWNIKTDDVGLDGVARTGDFGENDGRPTSGRGTDLPGEPNIDKTDIDESDMIGLTAFNIYSPWTIYPLNDDEGLWGAIQPGFLNAFDQIGNTDIMLGSGYFPLIPGQIERFSVGYMYGYHDELFRNNTYAKKCYRENYNFAKAPNIPTLTAIPGDNKVSLIWDDYAEKSVDPIIGQDFEGYRIYRSTDPGFNDMTPITDSHGSIAMRKPLAQFDLANGIQDYAPVPVNGVEFWLGSDTGIRNSYVDSTARNGQKYYYAVTSYDHGSGELGIAPSECSKYISISKDGAVDKGSNVAIARPEAPAAGYQAPEIPVFALQTGGTTTGKVGYQIVNTTEVPDAHRYRITFDDTLDLKASPATMYTTHLCLVDVTQPDEPDTVIGKSRLVKTGDILPAVDGFRLQLINPPRLELNAGKSGWNRPGILPFSFVPQKYSKWETSFSAVDYRIEFGEIGIDSTTAVYRGAKLLPAVPVNFTVRDMTHNKKVMFSLNELDGEGGVFSAFTVKTRSDVITFLQQVGDTVRASWEFSLATSTDSTLVNPQAGDFIDLILTKPFLSHDVFEFVTKGEHVDPKQAEMDLAKIKVVPNPYVVANSWEPLNPYSNGRGPRELHFTHLPEKCTIRIFNIRGQLVDVIEHHSPSISDGTEIWDMQTKDQLDISYGVYVYYIDAGALGQKTGKFAVIK